MDPEIARYRKTYSTLHEFGKMLARTHHDSSLLGRLIGALCQSDTPRSETFRALLGFRYLGLTFEEGLLEFRSNRYFLDSLDLKLLPSPDTVFSAIAEAEHEASILGLSKSFQSLVDTFIAEHMAKSSVNELPSIFRGHRMPILTNVDWSFLNENGYLIVRDAIPHELCDYLSERLKTLAQFESTSKKGGYFYGSGRMQRVYHLLGKDDIFRELLLHPICDEVMSHMFFRPTYHDKYYLTSFHGNILQPGAEPQIWHVDANVPDPLPSWIIRSNSNFVIQDYTKENGATEIILGSHKFLRKPNKAEAESLKFERIQMCAAKGSLVFWHGHLWHRSGANHTSVNRAALLATYAASFFREVCMEENPYLYLNTNTSTLLSPQMKRLLGWNHGAKDYA